MKSVHRKIGRGTSFIPVGLEYQKLVVIDGDEFGRCQTLVPS